MNDKKVLYKIKKEKFALKIKNRTKLPGKPV